MNIRSCEKMEKSVAELIVDISAEELETALGEAFKKNRSRISVPGFRRGKAPRKIIERMYGASIFHSDALDILLPEVMSFAVKESDIKIIGFPQVTDVDIKEDSSGAAITITAPLYPEVTLGEYKGLTAYKPAVDVPESEVDKEVDAARNRNVRIEKTDRPAADGDIAVIDFEGFVDGVPFEGGKADGHELTLGSGQFIPGFEDKVVGMSAGETRDLDLVFPENYTEPLAGKAVVFKVKLIEVKERLLPDLDDEFAKDVSEFDTLEEYKADIREKRRKMMQAEADSDFEAALMDKIIDSMEAEIPDVMVEEQMDNSMQQLARQISSYGMDPTSYMQMMNMTPEAMRENMRGASERNVRAMLALTKIAELEGITVTDEDVENEFKEAAERFGKDIEELKKSADEEAISSDLKLRRAAKIIAENAIATDQPEADDKDEKKAAKATTKTKKQTKAAAGEHEAEVSAESVETEAAEAEKPKKAATRKPAAKKATADAAQEAADVEPAAKKAPAKKASAKKTVEKVDDAVEADVAKPKRATKKTTEGEDK